MSAVLERKESPSALLAVAFKVQLKIQAPILTHGSQSLDYGLDAAMQLYHDVPVIGGSLIRGNLRHAWERLLALQEDSEIQFKNPDLKLSNADIRRWLGEGSGDDSYNRPKRARLNFDYFWFDEKKKEALETQGAVAKPSQEDAAFINKKAAKVRHRIRINENTGTVADGALQIIESPYDVGETPCFTGRIKAYVADETEREKLEHWLNKGLQFLAAIGAMKGVGFGRIASVECEQLKPVSASNPSLDALKAKQRWPLRLTLDRPFCVAAPHIPNDNRFVSLNEIPGNVLKGALAQTLEQLGLMEKARKQGFDQWRFSYALPVSAKQSQRPMVKPLSLATFKYKLAGDKDGRPAWVDVALKNQAGLLENKNGDDIEYLIPNFIPDWKEADFHFIDAALSSNNYPLTAIPERYLTVRTAVELERNAAQQSALFSLECVDPVGYEWDCFIDFSACPQHQADIQQWLPKTIQQHGIQGIGKTKAQALVKPGTAQVAVSQFKPLDQHFHILTLNTPALLLHSGMDLEQYPACDHEAVLHQAYADYFHHASGGQLQLNHFYAQQDLAGGEFYWRYYRSQSEESRDHYRPEMMTVAGSVFVLTLTEQADSNQIQAILQQWNEQGLPCAKSRSNETWRSDPYRPEHGYGEVWINHSIHMDSAQMKASLAQLGNKGVVWHGLD